MAYSARRTENDLCVGVSGRILSGSLVEETLISGLNKARQGMEEQYFFNTHCVVGIAGKG